MTPLITLTTDFGGQEYYVAAMKGVLASRCPRAVLLDLGHAVPAQDVVAGALFLEGAAPHFPAGTIHVAVIDPGVGTSRRPIAVHAGEQYFVCPDNGLLTLVLKRLPLHAARVIANPACMAAEICPTFHGRDIFAPSAGYLANGKPFDEVGPVVDALCQIDLPDPERVTQTLFRGHVIHVDAFGTLITNFRRESLGGLAIRRVRVGALVLDQVATVFSDVPEGQPVAYYGSSGRLEVGVNCGNASEDYGMVRGSVVEVEG
ncbi:MAG TPA: SAM-dependent chlorinase/fluorinase [Candidatus Hydrogenedentes bacterium]|nr:SAM-dependent chlorinase/fluorinase [Candidatus Hydrogenedentota bacterium]